MNTPAPATAADFEMRYDEHKTFPFFEDEDARIFGYGHPDKTEAARWVADYYQYIAGEDVEVSASDVTHQWAVRVEDDQDAEMRFIYGRPAPWPSPTKSVPIGPDEPGAFPIWTVAL